MFGLGTVTTHRALYSLLAILSCHPHVQRALQEEVDRVCGERQPLVADKVNMHYTQAVSLHFPFTIKWNKTNFSSSRHTVADSGFRRRG